MRIVVLGAGELGCTIAELLANEGHDVVVADSDEMRLERVRGSLDVLTVLADGVGPDFTRNPDIRDASVLVAVTDRDEMNILACLFAKKNGIKHRIARLRDVKFLEKSSEYIRDNFGIDLVLSPEQLTAKEIVRILMTPAALNVEDFANGAVRLFETRMEWDSPYVHCPLKKLELPQSVLAAMIVRDRRMMIPHGDDCLLPMDRVYFVGEPGEIRKLGRYVTKRRIRKPERVMMIGAGKTGQALVSLLQKEDIALKVIDKNRTRCEELAARLKKGSVLCGDGSDMDFLEREGVADADVVIGTTKDEQLNLLIALLAKHLGARQTIVRVIRSAYADLMTRIGVDVTLSVRLLAAGEVLGYIRRQGIVSLTLLESAEVEAMEISLPAGAPVVGIPLAKAGLPKEVLVCAFVRNGKAFIPKGDSVLETQDKVILITVSSASAQVLSYFKDRKEI